jgi:serine/threonine protein kinase
MDVTKVKLNERYVIARELGRGGLGIVYLAHDMHLHSLPVVIKTIRWEQEADFRDPWFAEKFEKEIKALLRIKHPGVVGVSDVGWMPDGKPFFVMPYVEGETLASAMQDGAMSLKRAAQIIRQISYALSAAHNKGVTHRDLKPDNVMLQTYESGEEVAILIDFGIATVRELQAEHSNVKTRIVGTLPYMAPEQLRGKPCPASDIWALGVLAYEMVTGRAPFPASNPVILDEMQRSGLSTLPKALRPELPDAAQEVILKALSYDPAARHHHAHDFGETFMRAALQESVDPILLTDEITLIREQSTLPAEERTLPMDENILDNAAAAQTPELGHVLFMDLVGFSRLPMSEQDRLLSKLRQIVLAAPSFKKASPGEQRISLDTGDGMALVFFGDPVAPVQCALDIASMLKEHPDVKLRMGVHSGPVFRRRDINENLNVTGSGINFAQRVMDSGDAGHILLSHNVADTLIQLGDWQEHLHDLGKHEVKHGLQLHLYNLCKGGLGCVDWPAGLKPASSANKNSNRSWRFGSISAALHHRCSDFFAALEEFNNPDKLRAFASVRGLESVKKCVPRSDHIDFDKFLSCLLNSGRERPALIDLLEVLSSRYEDDRRGLMCQSLLEELSVEIME